MFNLAGFVLLYACFSFVAGEKILLLPFQWGSHVDEMMAMAGEITAAKGHETFIVVTETFPGLEELRQKNPKTNVLTFKASKPDMYQLTQLTAEEIFEIIVKTPFKTFNKSPEMQQGNDIFCDNLLNDQQLLEDIRSLDIDLVIVDTIPHTACYYILPHKLGLRHIGYSAAYNPWLARNPSLPSFVPYMMTNNHDISAGMTFLQRLTNLWDMIDFNALTWVYNADDALVTKYVPEKPFKSISTIAGENIIWLLANDVVLDYPSPRMPNEFYIGGHKVKSAKPVSKEMDDFLKMHPEGTILISFGGSSMTPKKYFDQLLKAIAQVKYGVIWKCPLSSIPENVPSHIKLMDWIPQADLLGDPRIKLFITHAGMNSQFEALYNGVPMISFPMFGDQHFNAGRAKDRGFSLTVNILEFEPQDLLNNINFVINNGSFKNSIMAASNVYRNQPQAPAKRLVYWVDHVIKHGGDYLRAHALDMPWWQYLMLDILLVYSAALLVTFHIVLFVLRKLFGLFFSYGERKLKQS